LPVVYDEEAFAIVSAKLDRLRQALNCPVLLENGSFFTPVPDMEMSERAFLNLYAEGYCGVLDLHNLYVTWRKGLFYFGPIDRYLRVAAGEASRDLFAMARDGLRTKLRAAIRQAGQQHASVAVGGAQVDRNGDAVAVSVSVRLLHTEDEERPRPR
jgi:hypothetical protein